MVNNTAEDDTPYFLTANHCGINTGNAASMVVYWNFQSPVCGQQGGGSLADFQTGATFQASSSTSDFCLVELNAAAGPGLRRDLRRLGPQHRRRRAGAIGDPSPQHRREEHQLRVRSDLDHDLPAAPPCPATATHIRITDWDLGTTEPGSSGSPLFDQNHHDRGPAARRLRRLRQRPSDWYGRFSLSWTYLAPYLDPLGTGATSSTPTSRD